WKTKNAENRTCWVLGETETQAFAGLGRRGAKESPPTGKSRQKGREYDTLQSIGRDRVCRMPAIDLDRLAELARIELTAEHAAAFRADLERVLALVDRLQAVDTSGVEPMSHPLDLPQRLREDAVTEPDQRDVLL